MRRGQGDTVSSGEGVDGSFGMMGLCLEGWKSLDRWRGGRRDELAGTGVLSLGPEAGRRLGAKQRMVTQICSAASLLSPP